MVDEIFKKIEDDYLKANESYNKFCKDTQCQEGKEYFKEPTKTPAWDRFSNSLKKLLKIKKKTNGN